MKWRSPFHSRSDLIHISNRVVVVVRHSNETKESRVLQDSPALRVFVHPKKLPAQSAPHNMRNGPVDHPGRNGTGTQNRYRSKLLRHRWLSRELHLQNRAVYGGRIDPALQNHLKGSLMRTGFHDAAKVTGPHSSSGEVVSNDVVAGMRPGLVISSYRAAQIIKRPEAAVRAHNEIRVVNRPAAIPCVPHHRGRQQLNGSFAGTFPGVGQTTNPADMDLASIEQGLPFLPRNTFDEFNRNTELLSDECRKALAERFSNLCLAGRKSQHDRSICLRRCRGISRLSCTQVLSAETFVDWAGFLRI